MSSDIGDEKATVPEYCYSIDLVRSYAFELLQMSGVHHIECFGDLVTKGEATNPGLIIVVHTWETYDNFFCKTTFYRRQFHRRRENKTIPFSYTHWLSCCKEAMEEIWEGEFPGHPVFPCDLLLVPGNWRSNLLEMEADVYHQDWQHMTKIAAEAEVIACHLNLVVKNTP
jgi:hypothetical protein